MALTAAQLIASVSVTGVEESTAKLATMAGATDEAGASFGKLAGIGTAAIAALAIGVAVKSVQMAGDFQAGLTQLVTGANEAKSNLALVGNGILTMAVTTGTGTKALSDAMFLVESAGYHGAAGLQVLQIAAEGAKTDNADLTQITDVLTTAMHDYTLSASESVPVMNSLIKTVADGKMHMDDLNQSLTKVLPVSDVFKVKLTDVEGALATMASAGDKGAAAGTHLAMMLKGLENPAGAASKEMAAMGINSVNLAQTMQTSLPQALQDIQNAVGQHFVPGSVEYNRAIATILGGSKSGIAGLEIMGSNMKDLVGNTKDVANAFKNSGKAVTGWSDIQGDFNFKLDQAKEVLETLAIRIGTFLLPILGKLLDWFVNNGAPALERFGGFIQSTVIPALLQFGSAIGNVISIGVGIVNFFKNNQAAALALLIPLGMLSAVLVQMAVVAIVAFIASIPAMVAGFIAWAVAAGAAAVATLAATWPILAIGAIVGLVVAGIILAIQHWGAIMTWFKTVWADFSSWFGNVMSAIGAFFKGVWTGIENFFTAVWNHIVAFAKTFGIYLIAAILGPAGIILALIITHWSQIQAFISNTWNNIVSSVRSFISTVITTVAVLGSRLLSFFGNLANQAISWGAHIIENLASGIVGAIGSAIGGAMSAVGNFISSHLPSSPAKMGPLVNLEKQGAQISEQIAKGMRGNLPAIQTSLHMLLTPIGPTLVAGAGSMSGGHGPITVNVAVDPEISLDGVRLSRGLMKHITSAIRYNSGGFGF